MGNSDSKVGHDEGAAKYSVTKKDDDDDGSGLIDDEVDDSDDESENDDDDGVNAGGQTTERGEGGAGETGNGQWQPGMDFPALDGIFPVIRVISNLSTTSLKEVCAPCCTALHCCRAF